MADQLFFDNTPLSFAPDEVLGEGGEAIVYKRRVKNSDLAFKVFRLPDDPFYDVDDPGQKKRNQDYARKRLVSMQTKLHDFPRPWSKQVITPQGTIVTRGGEIRGYAMPVLPQTMKLRDFVKLKLRPAGVDNNTIVQIFKSLWVPHSETHKAGVVIGDDNYFNVLVALSDFVAYMIDADSMQFGKYKCRAFLPAFVDPLICDPKAKCMIQEGDHSVNTDWYAFASMFFEIMFRVPLYGGTYEPTDKKKAVEHHVRPLHRIPVFHSDGVIYPTSAVPLRCIDDDVMEFYSRLIYKDWRGEFPMKLLQRLQWNKCPQCGVEHSRARCPDCAHAAPRAAVAEEIRGKVRTRRILHTAGVVLRAAIQGGKLHCLYHVNGEFHRMVMAYHSKGDTFSQEVDNVILRGDISPEMRFGIQGNNTLIGLDSQLVVLDLHGTPVDQIPVDRYRHGWPVFDANEKHFYWAGQGKLWRNDDLAPFYIGDLMPSQSRFWVGPDFGFGFYQAGGVQVAFVFDAEQRGINDNVQLPRIQGTIIEASASFDRSRCWFFVTAQDGQKQFTHCFVIDSKGNVIAQETAEEDDGSWLDKLQGRCAVRLTKPDSSAAHVLFTASDKGLGRIHEESGQIRPGAEFPDTKGLVHSNHELLFGTPGIYVFDRHEVRCVQVS